jgi:hypothetical protein
MSLPVIPPGKENDPFYHVPPYNAETQLEPNYFCRARNVKREKYCRAKAGQGTDHLGQGRCKNHGGSVPITHGRYSSVIRDSLGEHLDHLELEEESEQLDILPEARMLRAIGINVVERFNEFVEGILKWNEQEAEEAAADKRRPRFLNVPDIKDVGKVVKDAAEVVNMVHKQRSQNAITLSDFYRLMAAMAEAVDSVIENTFGKTTPRATIEKAVSEIQEKWKKIKLKA